MKDSDKNFSDKNRRSFLVASALAFAGLIIGKVIPGSLSGKKPAASASGEKIKMLTADGKLVEVDRSFIKNSRKATTQDVMHWIKKN